MSKKVDKKELDHIHQCFANDFKVDGAYQLVKDNNQFEKKDGKLGLTKRIVTAIKNNQQKEK